MKAKESFENESHCEDWTLLDEFIAVLEDKIAEARIMLKERFDWICSQPADSAKFMYENNVMAGYDGKTTFSALRHGTLAVG